MKRTRIGPAVLAVLLIPPAAFAEDAPPASPLSFNVGVVSDYVFRGVSQTHGKPALQGGIDYADPSGFYVGAWASNITWVKDWLGKGSLELDVYGGFKNTFAGGDWSYDVGYITYNYPGHGSVSPGNLANPNTQELYLSLGYKWLAAKYSYATSSHFIGWFGGPAFDQSTRGSDYLELNGNYDLGDGWTLIGHLGHQQVKNFVANPAVRDASYSDWKIGATKDVGFGVIGLAYSATNADGSCGSPLPATGASAYCWGTNGTSTAAPTGNFRDVAKGTAVLSFVKTF
jgi:uncharacterized protein (TIGR02001 family)